MSNDVRLTALSEFLKTHRAKLQPGEVGLPAGGRRRTPGLRREEVAQLSGVSTTWYTWLEQGRDITVSAQVLDRIAFALQLNEDERKYLFMLALEQPTISSTADNPPMLSPAISLILNELRYFPTIVSDRRCNIVGWNQAAAGVFMDFELVPIEERNIIWLLFTRKEFKTLAANWSDFVRGFLAIFRSYYGQYMGDTWYSDFIEKISNEKPEFQHFWHHNDVNSAPEVFIEFRHAKAGKMLFDLTSMQIQGHNDLRFSVYTPSANSDTETKMRQLMRKLEQE
ncbi:DNA-binding protein [Aneurinibacillus migulanus]|uniref:helix-turn-helix transcriptional regulator n=1 Tax=Aneurinibacillus migulanus TaxID=47500 RepID=UPI0005BCAD3C|nr:helix-turn-helix transcriptional regulator [Aneurinibacillus migulanus]KIV58064.1 DNA-binding protein [Aneurinibacillus migulanus]KPD06282.1 DNA-binding protein [Aneurinibacillus migulanus]MCP1355850.1 helix-turn-helix transcriptional regulator [Aneurinibacillus migulanus]